MATIEPVRCLSWLSHQAEHVGCSLNHFFKVTDSELRGVAPTELCLALPQLAGLELIAKGTRAHIPKCLFCKMFLRVVWLASASEEETAEVCEKVAKEQRLHLEYIEARSQDAAKDKRVGPCFDFMTFISFSRLSGLAAKHRKACKRCHMLLTIFESAPLPDLP